MIYLDSAATTKPYDEVVEVIEKYLKEMWMNPSSLYSPSKQIAVDIVSAKETIADFVNCRPEEIYFTSCGSESNCWAIQGFVNACMYRGKTPSIVTTTIEHKSIIDCVEHLNCDFHFIGVDSNGEVNEESLIDVLKSIPADNKILVSIQYANNEIGTIQNISNLINIAHSYGAIFHTDATQVFGQKKIDVDFYDIDMFTASGHKIHASKGIGLLYISNKVRNYVLPLIYGSQMNGMRGGTENVPYIMGLKKAVEIRSKLLDNSSFDSGMREKRDYLLHKLRQYFDISINGREDNRLSSNLNITFQQDISAEALIYMLDMCEIYFSSGSACNSHSAKPSYVLKAIGLSDDEAMRTIRITLPENISLDDIDKVISEFKKQIDLMQQPEF